MFIVKVYINLKKEVADPQGLTVKDALLSLGYEEVKDVRVGKIVNIVIEHKDRAKVENRVRQMCKDFLANPVIETFNFTIEER